MTKRFTNLLLAFFFGCVSVAGASQSGFEDFSTIAKPSVFKTPLEGVLEENAKRVAQLNDPDRITDADFKNPFKEVLSPRRALQPVAQTDPSDTADAVLMHLGLDILLGLMQGVTAATSREDDFIPAIYLIQLYRACSLLYANSCAISDYRQTKRWEPFAFATFLLLHTLADVVQATPQTLLDAARSSFGGSRALTTVVSIYGNLVPVSVMLAVLTAYVMAVKFIKDGSLAAVLRFLNGTETSESLASVEENTTNNQKVSVTKSRSLEIIKKTQ